MKTFYLSVVISAVLTLPAVAAQNTASQNNKPKREAPAKKPAPHKDVPATDKSHTRPIDDIESFFNEGMEQAKIMPPGCRPKLEPDVTTKPVA